MSGTSGPTSLTPFAIYDPEASCWRTSQGTFLSDSETFSEKWPRSGMTLAGCAYELPMPALPTAEPESSSLQLMPTPTTTGEGAQGPVDPEAWQEWKRERMSRGIPTGQGQLGTAVRTLLPTPAVNDMGAAYTPQTWDAWTARMQEKHSNGNGHGKSLSIEAQRLLPTPEAKLSDSGPDYARANRAGSGGDDLTTTVARLFPTPRASDGEKGGPNQRGSSGDLMLPSAVCQMLPTPTSRDHKGANQRGDTSCLHGALTNPPSDAGSASRDAELPGQLSLDVSESD